MSSKYEFYKVFLESSCSKPKLMSQLK